MASPTRLPERRRASTSTPASGSPPRARAAGGTGPSRPGRARAASGPPPDRALDADEERRSTRGARPGRSPACRSDAAVSAKPRSITTGPSSCTSRFAARSERWAMPDVVQQAHLPPDRIEQVVGELGLGHGVERGARRPAPGEDHGLVRQRRHGRDPGAAHTAPPGQHHEERLVGDVVVQVLRRPRVGRASEQRGPVGAEQDVRVAAVTAVHLEEHRGALDRIGVVELGPAAVGAAQLEAIELQPGARQRRRRRRREGAPVRGTEDDEDGRADHRARPPPPAAARGCRRCRRSPSPRASPSTSTSAACRHDRDSHGLPTMVAAAAPTRYGSVGNRVDATQVSPVRASASRPGRSSARSSSEPEQARPRPPARASRPMRRKRSLHRERSDDARPGRRARPSG